ncbi:MAG TPA: flavin reductase family protein [Gemmatimonadaceae bacterium]|nr:flavin reductase family protein [Gemmatimonadaceae bacterium]
MPIDKDLFRAVLGRFASGVTIVTTTDAEGRDQGMTVSAFSSLSLDPPLVLVCIAHNASVWPAFEAASHFAINILSSTQEALSRRFSSKEGDRFDGVGFTRGATGVALLDDTLAAVECTVTAVVPHGDHSILVGSVEAGTARDLQPLLYYRGGYASLTR